jgi:hypothetical protein
MTDRPTVAPPGTPLTPRELAWIKAFVAEGERAKAAAKFVDMGEEGCDVCRQARLPRVVQGSGPRVTEATSRQLEAWEAYVATGGMKAAADRLGIHEITVRKRIAELRDVYDVRTNVQLAIAIERARAA